ncbi:MAG: polyprenyl synthetase family protein, partial [Rhodospirillaceae bacterium]|nr:polyprenyl synthetase family protein [Rhodospirillaceae bacterium]
MQSPVALIPQLAGHIIAAGGKRLRPMLTLAAAQICGYQGLGHIRLATAVEFIHTATLLHDDVVDESDLRRGETSANVLWGNKASVLVGDFLFSRAFQLMVADGSLRILEILCGASAKIAEGEVLQLMTSNDTATTEQAYLEVIKGKTAILFSAACEVGAVLADRPKREQESLASFGLNLGIAFQLIDDALDYSAKQEALGKKIGDDFREGKITLPVILAFLRGEETEREFVAPDPGAAGAERRRPRRGAAPDRQAQRPRRHRAACQPLRRDGARRPRHLPRQRRQARADRGGRLLHPPGALSAAGGSQRRMARLTTLVDAATAAGAHVSEIARKEGWRLLQTWRETYCAPMHAATGKWVIGSCSWHTFSGGYHRCLQRSRAFTEYHAQDATDL